MKPPFFIIGNPRSGTTLLRLMLTCHPRIVIPPEAGFAVWLYKKYQGLMPDRRLCNAFLSDLLKTRKFETWGLSRPELVQAIDELSPKNYSELVICVYRAYMRSQHKIDGRWGDKNNFYLDHIDTLNELFPYALFIHIVRDPRSVAGSYRQLQQAQIASKYAPDLPHQPDEIARGWQNNIRTIQHSFRQISQCRVYELRFEDLLTDTEAALLKICRFLDEPYDTAMLNYHVVNRAKKLEPEEMLQWKQFTLEPPRHDRIDRYRHDLTSQDINIIEQITADELRHYGYCPESVV